MPAAGQTADYRPIPRDFEETFIRVGWTGIEDECRAHAKTIAKWIERLGRDRLRAARAAYLLEHGRALPATRIAGRG